jgi:hypothetical protein
MEMEIEMGKMRAAWVQNFPAGLPAPKKGIWLSLAGVLASTRGQTETLAVCCRPAHFAVPEMRAARSIIWLLSLLLLTTWQLQTNPESSKREKGESRRRASLSQRSRVQSAADAGLQLAAQMIQLP